MLLEKSMLPKRSLATLLVLVILSTVALAQNLSSPDFSAIVKQLASPDFAQREAAQAALEKLPREQVWDIQAQADSTPDPEVAARLRNALWQIAADALHRDFASPPAPFKLTARVLDPDGKPLPHASVGLNLPLLDRGLSTAFRPQTTTDPQGRFSLNVPYNDIPYSIRVDAPGFSPAMNQSLIPQDPKAADTVITLRSYNPQLQKVQGVVTDDQGRPVPNRELKFIGDYGMDFFTTTGPNGEYAITCPPDAIKYAQPSIQLNDLVPPKQGSPTPKPPSTSSSSKPPPSPAPSANAPPASPSPTPPSTSILAKPPPIKPKPPPTAPTKSPASPPAPTTSTSTTPPTV